MIPGAFKNFKRTPASHVGAHVVDGFAKDLENAFGRVVFVVGDEIEFDHDDLFGAVGLGVHE